MDLPGVDPEDVRLTFEKGHLTVEGERRRRAEPEEESLLWEEVCYGPFHRTLYIPGKVIREEVKAKYRNGVLEITAPVDENAMPQRIKVEEVAG